MWHGALTAEIAGDLIDHRMDLVHDHRLDGLEHGAPARTGQQDIKGFRGCDQDVSGERRMRRRSAAGVSPMRTPDQIAMSPHPSRSISRAMSERDLLHGGLHRPRLGGC
jgi:hypothetical protein